jgi:hypothetical protein
LISKGTAKQILAIEPICECSNQNILLNKPFALKKHFFGQTFIFGI